VIDLSSLKTYFVLTTQINNALSPAYNYIQPADVQDDITNIYLLKKRITKLRINQIHEN
tara:strand:+ start:310 stop:486 length:177 start_codon:yes stop_codon:yes gene_type:complete